MLRFSLLTLLMAVVLAAVACASLVNASPLWAQPVTTATILALMVATVAAFYLRSRARAFPGGFAIVGWTYLLLIHGPWFEGVKVNLLTTAAVDGLHGLMNKEDASAEVALSLAYAASDSGTLTLVPYVGAPNSAGQSPLSSFRQIGHSHWTILLACVGGVLARVFNGSRSQRVEALGARPVR